MHLTSCKLQVTRMKKGTVKKNYSKAIFISPVLKQVPSLINMAWLYHHLQILVNFLPGAVCIGETLSRASLISATSPFVRLFFCPCSKRVLHTKMVTFNTIVMIIKKITTDNMAITNMASKGRHIAKKNYYRFLLLPRESHFSVRKHILNIKKSSKFLKF